MKRQLIGIVATLVLSIFAVAAVPPHPLKVVQNQGAFFGGQAGPGFSLLGVKNTQPKSNMERVFFSIGDLHGKAMKGLPGYYHVELRGREIIINFPQMPETRISAEQLQKALSQSKMIAKSSITSDSSDGSLNVILDLNRPVKLNVLQVPGEKYSSQVVLQLIQ